MRTISVPDPLTRILPEGRRWGFGAHTVVPYLTMALQVRPGDDTSLQADIRNPVFPQMENALRALQPRH